MKRLHSLEDHNYHIKRHKYCPYCATGSKPVPKAAIKKDAKDGKIYWFIGIPHNQLEGES